MGTGTVESSGKEVRMCVMLWVLASLIDIL